MRSKLFFLLVSFALSFAVETPCKEEAIIYDATEFILQLSGERSGWISPKINVFAHYFCHRKKRISSVQYKAISQCPTRACYSTPSIPPLVGTPSTLGTLEEEQGISTEPENISGNTGSAGQTSPSTEVNLHVLPPPFHPGQPKECGIFVCAPFGTDVQEICPETHQVIKCCGVNNIFSQHITVKGNPSDTETVITFTLPNGDTATLTFPFGLPAGSTITVDKSGDYVVTLPDGQKVTGKIAGACGLGSYNVNVVPSQGGQFQAENPTYKPAPIHVSQAFCRQFTTCYGFPCVKEYCIPCIPCKSNPANYTPARPGDGAPIKSGKACATYCSYDANKWIWITFGNDYFVSFPEGLPPGSTVSFYEEPNGDLVVVVTIPPGPEDPNGQTLTYNITKIVGGPGAGNGIVIVPLGNGTYGMAKGGGSSPPGGPGKFNPCCCASPAPLLSPPLDRQNIPTVNLPKEVNTSSNESTTSTSVQPVFASPVSPSSSSPYPRPVHGPYGH